MSSILCVHCGVHPCKSDILPYIETIKSFWWGYGVQKRGSTVYLQSKILPFSTIFRQKYHKVEYVWPPRAFGIVQMIFWKLHWIILATCLYPTVLWYKSCRLHLLYVVFDFMRMPQLILHHVHDHSISCHNVKYPFPVFPHSVSDLWSEQS